MFISPRMMTATLRLGLTNIWAHKMRSSLTILGILIGVTAVIWLVAMGDGVSQQAQEQIKSLGATSIIIRSKKPDESTGSSTAGSFFIQYGLLRDDFKRINLTVPGVVSCTPVREVIRSARYFDRQNEIRLVGCTPEYFNMNRLELERGRLLNDNDLDKKHNVCVIANDVALTLFPGQDPLGQAVQISSDDDFYIVVGLTKNRMPTAGIGGSLAAQDYNYDIYIPIRTFWERIGDTVMTTRSGSREGEVLELSQITVKVRSIEEVDAASRTIQALLERFHPIRDYSITIPKELLRQAETLRMMFTVLLILIAGISLVVGGIGIMNIMLATVTERTREIGIRMALGARQADILWQFLLETLLLTFTGGLLGVGIGLLCRPMVRLIQKLGAQFSPNLYAALPDAVRNLEPIVAPWSIGVSLVIAVFVGVFFGLYPARQAANMDPIEALRHE